MIYYTTKQFAKLTGLAEGTVRNYVADKRIESQLVYGSRVIPESEIPKFKKVV